MLASLEHGEIATPRKWALLLQKSHFAQDICKPGIGVKRVEPWIHIDRRKPLGAVFVNLLKPLECLVWLA